MIKFFYGVITFYFKIFITGRPRETNFAEIIKFATMVIRTIFKNLKKSLDV